MPMQIQPIGIIHSPFTEPAGTPIQPAAAKGVEGQVEVFPEFVAGLKDLEGFERIWLIYWFHQAAAQRLRVVPFLDTVERGVFATRAPCRPNPIGLSAVKLVGVEGNRLRVQELDVLEGTPLLDLKPYTSHFDHFPVSRNGWLDQVAKDPGLADRRFSRERKFREE